jgi:ubiquinone/menaquinone biosynthesis C-methylase UbiE
MSRRLASTPARRIAERRPSGLEAAMGSFLPLTNLIPSRLQRIRDENATRNILWDRLYGHDWGEVTTNNYGFAPAEGDAPERFQFQMYAEHLKALRASGRLKDHTDLLEVSCGRGGGLAHLAGRWPGTLAAVGLDWSGNALATCRERHCRLDNLSFVQGDALSLPFPDGAFDVVLNVEASNDYGDYAGFFGEVNRVLRPGGVFLYCDTRRPDRIARTSDAMHTAGLSGELRDVTANVLEACRLDTPRREALMRRRIPWLYRVVLRKVLRNYAAVSGSERFGDFQEGRRRYIMACAVKSAARSA